MSIVAAVVAAVFCASSNPIVAFWMTTSDELTIPAFVVEVLARPYEFAGWQLSRSSFLFPDAVSYLAAYSIARDAILAIPLSMVPILLAWLYLVWDSAQDPRRDANVVPLLWAVAAGLLVPLALSLYAPSLAQWVLKYYFTSSNHFSCVVFGILLLHWSIAWLASGSPWRLLSIATVLALMAMSNRAIWAFYAAPLCVTLLVHAAGRSRVDAKRLIALGVVAAAAMAVGYVGEGSLNRIALQPYEMTLAALGQRIPRMAVDIGRLIAASPAIGLFLACLLGIYGVALWKLCIGFPRWARSREFGPEESRFLFDFALVAGGLGNILAASIAWEAIDSARYLVFFFFAPILLIPRVWGGLVRMRTLAVGIPILATLSAYSVLASGAPLDPRVYARKATSGLVECISALGGNRGIANYWEARRMGFLSNGALRIDQLTPWKTRKQDLLFYWGNNAFSFLRGHPDIDPYDYIVADALDPALLEEMFGAPDEKRACAGREIWSYRDPTHVFPRLFQGNLAPYQRLLSRESFISIPAGVLGAAIGTRDGIGRQAAPPADSAGFLAYGGYLSLEPGDYRFAVDYASLGDAASKRDKPGRFEVFDAGAGSVLGVAELGVKPNQTRASATVDIHVPKSAIVEPRVFYYGASPLRVEAISIARRRAPSEIAPLSHFKP